MGEKNLPIKLVLQKASDTQKNQGGGNINFFVMLRKNFRML